MRLTNHRYFTLRRVLCALTQLERVVLLAEGRRKITARACMYYTHDNII